MTSIWHGLTGGQAPRRHQRVLVLTADERAAARRVQTLWRKAGQMILEAYCEAIGARQDIARADLIGLLDWANSPAGHDARAEYDRLIMQARECARVATLRAQRWPGLSTRRGASAAPALAVAVFPVPPAPVNRQLFTPDPWSYIGRDTPPAWCVLLSRRPGDTLSHSTQAPPAVYLYWQLLITLATAPNAPGVASAARDPHGTRAALTYAA